MLVGNGNEALIKKIAGIEDKIIAFMLETRAKYKNYYTVSVGETTEAKSFTFYAEGEIYCSCARGATSYRMQIDEKPEAIVKTGETLSQKYIVDGGYHILRVTPTADATYIGEGEPPLLPFAAEILLSGNIMAIK